MYSTFRNEILKAHASSSRRLHHRPIPHPLLKYNQTEIFTDYFYSPEKKEKCLVLLSGVHGVEGYLGSLIQRSILQSELADFPFQIVIVHAVNPYGMAACQRTNANNVDLNRNVLTEYKIERPQYRKFLPYLRTGSFLGYLWTLLLILRLGLDQTVDTVTGGQTEFPDLVFFAGHELQPELISLQENLKSIISPTAHLYVLDVHTGLGKRGEESLILDGFDSDEEQKFFERIFKAPSIYSGRTPGGYQALGTASLLLKKTWKSFHCFQEFGTDPPMKVLRALIRRDPKITLQRFFPDDESWRKHCVDLGLLRFRQTVEELSSN